MRHLSAIILLIASVSLKAQDTTKVLPKTIIEKLTIQSGILIQQEYADVGSVLGIEFQAMKVTDIRSKTATKGIYITWKYSSLYSSTSYSGFIDEDELSDIFLTLDYLTSSKFKFSSEATDVQVVYTSRGDFQIGCFSDGDKWKFFIKIDKHYSNSRVFLSNDKDFNELISLFKASKAIMDKL